MQIKTNTIFKIINNTNLEEVLNFLVCRFKQSKKFKENFYNFLTTANKNDNFYGFYLADNENKKIVGALLCARQFSYFSSSLEKLIIVFNLNTWYMEPSVRGLGTKKFFDEAVSNLEGYSITSYTSNKAASKVLLSSGFKPMSYFELKVTAKQSFKQAFFLKRLSCSYPKELNETDAQHLETGYSIASLAQSKIYEFKLNNKKLYICIVINKTSEKLYSLFKARINIAEVLWVSDLKLFQDHVHEIFFGLFLKKFALFLELNLSVKDYNKYFNNHNDKFYISEGKKFLVKSIDAEKDFYQPIGSEKGIQF